MSQQRGEHQRGNGTGNKATGQSNGQNASANANKSGKGNGKPLGSELKLGKGNGKPVAKGNGAKRPVRRHSSDMEGVQKRGGNLGHPHF
ncbi:hypothetical protein [Aeromonas allosaccharophila]|uniref:hypothetical protein n=1 Tax=Aeromonas allosaccharophila TaxID=656 RepID=UPI002ADFA829|nr:hypothetical protein [Aeromonas allosaccharophila]